MNELQLPELNDRIITEWDFPQIKAYIGNALESYKNIVYTDDSVKAAKDDKSELNKVKKLIEDKRKEYKNQCLAPYNAVEPQIKELVGMIDEQVQLIDVTVKNFTEKQKAEKEQLVKEFYLKKAVPLGVLAEPLWKTILDPKWLNATTSRAKYEEEIQHAVNKAAGDIAEIRALDSPFCEALLEEYARTLSVDAAKQKNAELSKAMEQAGYTAKELAPEEKKQKTIENVSAEDGTAVKVYATKLQLDDIFDFLEAIGVKYEVM